MIDPHDSRAKRFHNAERFVDIARPDGRREAVRRVVGDANCFRFPLEGNHGSDRTKNFFASDTRAVIHVIEDRRLDVVALAELLWASAADGYFGFLLANFEVGADAVVLLLAHQRPHLCFAIEWRAQLDALGLLRHGFDEFCIDFLFHQDAAARGTNFTLIDKDAEESAIDGSFPIRAIKENIRRLAAKLERDALKRVRSALDDDFAHGGAARECDFVHTGMRYQRSSRRFSEAVDNVHHAWRQPNFCKPVGDFHHGERRLLGRLEHAGASRGDRRSELPGSHDQRIVPGNNLASDSHRFTQSETQRIRGHGIDVPQNFVRQTGIIFETSCGIGDVVLRFDNGLAGIAAFQLGELRGVRANFLSQLVKKAATLGSAGLRPRAGIKRGARCLHGLVDVRGRSRSNVRDHFFGRRIVNGKHLAGRTLDPLPIDIVLIGSNDCFRTARHHCLPNSLQSAGAAPASFRAALRLP